MYGAQKVIKLATRDDPEITTTQKIIHLDQTSPINLADNGFDIMVSMIHRKHLNTRGVPINIPSDIGYFKMIAVEYEENS